MRFDFPSPSEFSIRLFAAAVLSSWLIAPLASGAGESLASSPFSLRFPAAFSHFSPFADVAAKGGASAASPFGSSFNLAGIAWGFQPDAFNYQVSANYDYLDFAAGTEMQIGAQTLAFDAAEAGIFRVSLVEFQSNSNVTRQAPVRYEFDLLGTRLDWSKKLGEYGIGAGIGFTHSDTLFSPPLLKLSDSEKDNWTFRLAGQRQLGKRWLVGVTADYGNGDSDIQREVAPGLKQSVSESTEQWVAQTGLAFMITPKAVAHLDYQYARFSNDSEELTTHRWSLGTDIPLASWCLLRTGASTDQYGNLGWSTGLGFIPREGSSINLAYQNGFFPELDREFGHSQMFNLSLSFKW